VGERNIHKPIGGARENAKEGEVEQKIGTVGFNLVIRNKGLLALRADRSESEGTRRPLHAGRAWNTNSKSWHQVYSSKKEVENEKIQPHINRILFQLRKGPLPVN